MQFPGSLTPCPAPNGSCRRLTCLAIAVIACDHVLYVVVVALRVFVGVECDWCCDIGLPRYVAGDIG